MSVGGGAEKVPETEEERMLARIGLDKIARHKKINQPIEEKWMARRAEQGRIRREAAGETTSQTRRAFGDVQEQIARGASSDGLGGGRDIDAITGGVRDEASSMALSQAGAREAADDSYVAGLQGVVSLGEGESANAISELGGVANAAAQQAEFDASMSQRRHSNNMEGLGMAAGFAAQRGVEALNKPAKGSGQAFINKHSAGDSVFDEPIR